MRRSAYLLPLAFVFFIGTTTVQSQTLISTTTTYDGVQVGLTGALSIDGNPTPTLFLQNVATLTAGLTTLTIGEPQGGALYLSGGSTLTNSGNSTLGADSSVLGTAVIEGPSSLWNMGGDLTLGLSGIGIISVTGGGHVQSNVGFLGYNATGDGTATISGAGSQWTVTSGLYLGGTVTSSGGTGSMIVVDGGALNVGGTLTVWNAGTLTLDGGASINVGTGSAAADTLSIFADGTFNLEGGSVTVPSFDRTTGTFNFNDGTLTVSGGVYTQASGTLNINGALAASLSRFVLDDGASVVGVNQVYVGGSRQGELQILGGSTLDNTGYGVSLGTLASGDGTVTVSGAGSSLVHSGIVVGKAGKGTLEVLAGGRVDGGTGIFIGQSAGSTGIVNVSGLNSTWTTRYLFIGDSGTGSLSVLDGGTVHTLNEADVGYFPDSVGKVTVSGAGSTWNVGSQNDFLYVGYSGQGTLNILDGGAVNSYAAVLSVFTNNNSALVSGANSTWTNAGIFDLGAFGNSHGSLTVADGGLVTVGDALTVYASSTLTIDGGSVVAQSFLQRLTASVSLNDGRLAIDGGTYENQNDPRLVINGVTVDDSPVFTLSNNAKTVGVRTLVVGSSNNGTFQIMSGSTLTNFGSGGAGTIAGIAINDGYNYLGLAEGSTGTAVVDGGTWNSLTGRTYVGYQGTGELTITGGGRLFNSSAILGIYPTGAGTAVVSGAGSAWTSSFDLTLGSGGSGSLSVLDGGVVSNSSGFLGADSPASSGTALVSGAGSTWSNSHSLYIGGSVTTSAGTGILTVADNGLVTVGGTLKVWETGTLNLSGGTVRTSTLDIATGIFNFTAGTLEISSAVTAAPGYQFDLANSTLVNNGTIHQVVNAGSGAVVKGTGTFDFVNINAGGTLSPGNSVGQLNVSGTDLAGGASLTLNAGANIIFEFKNAGGATPGTDWDLLDLGAGILDLGTADVTAGNQIKLHIDPWLADNMGHGANDFDPSGSYDWLFIEVDSLSNLTGGIADPATSANIADYFEIVDNGLGQGVFGAGNPFTEGERLTGPGFGLAWKTGTQGSGLYVTYSAVPEPGSMILGGLASAACGWYGRRRSRKDRKLATVVATTASS